MISGRFALRLVVTLGAWLAPLLAHAIVHGKAVRQADFASDYPWAVAIENPLTGGVCAGVVISPTYVLTAAHCTSASKRVRYGHTARSRARTATIAEAIRHPFHDVETQQFDVGLLRLESPLEIPPLTLISLGEYLLLVKHDADAEVMGWGKRPGSDFSDRLVRAPIKLARLLIRGTYLYYDDRGGPCGGDSGGPLVMAGLDGKPVLVGVASTTDGNLCATGGGIAGYTNLVAVMNFVEEHVSDLPPG